MNRISKLPEIELMKGLIIKVLRYGLRGLIGRLIRAGVSVCLLFVDDEVLLFVRQYSQRYLDSKTLVLVMTPFD